MSENVVFFPDPAGFDGAWQAAAVACTAPPPDAHSQALRIELWRKQEFHNWLRWRICRKGFDWSKPLVLGMLALGFGLLVAYGALYDRWYLTAGGIVAWFTVVNLSFFTYFGLTLPGPPRALPGPVEPPGRYRAEVGLYPSGYERRRRPRVCLRMNSTDGATLRFELAFAALEPALAQLLQNQTLWRMQRGDAPLTQAVVEFARTTRAELDAGLISARLVAWKWDSQALVPFGSKSFNA
jgi:hypothetical protein